MLRIIFILLFVLPLVNLQAQESIGGVVNEYYTVSTVLTDQVEVVEAVDGLKPGDKMLLIQMTGLGLFTTSGFEVINGVAKPFSNEGNYEFLAIESVNTATKRVVFTADISRSYTNGEKIQLVKVYETERAVINSELTADDWDGNKGGIVALVVYEKLTLNNNINISGKGFRGAEPEPDYVEACRTAYNPDTFYFPSTVLATAGRKGEGIVSTSFTYTKGLGHAINGGGGGNGYFAGGGGGSNFGDGRNGGTQDNSCTSSAGQYARGGMKLGDGYFYKNALNKVVMGGGGGSSTESTTNSASQGGDGGGIVFILSDSVQVVSGSIIADGGSVTTSVPAGGGGGGGGGTVVMDVINFQNNLQIDVSGGKGGNTTTCSGAGGGGGGGIVWYSGADLPSVVEVDSTGGARGISFCGSNGSTGIEGGTLSGFSPVLNGFLFNYIIGKDTICAGLQPNEFTGSRSKGDGDLDYFWIQSTDSVNWVAASGTGDSLNFQPAALSTTTYFSRVVTDGTIRDTARSIKVYVYPAITNNVLTVTDTLCENQSTGTLYGNTPGGGNGSYSFRWQSSPNQTSWNNIGTSEDIAGSTLTNTTYYRRIVSSTIYCTDTSDINTVTVLIDIGNNSFINPDTVICENLDAGILKARSPQNGDGIYRYSWLESDNNSVYNDIAGQTGETYSPGILTSDKYYKRIVYSGNGDVCVDTTDVPRTITVLASITNNTIATDSTRFCAGDTPNLFTGTSPGGGAGNYSYQWIRRAVGSNWNNIASATIQNYNPSQIYEDTSHVARIVISGMYGACKDTSNLILLDVIPYINNTLVSADETLCELTVPATFSESVATGGAGSGYTYLWLHQPGGTGDWTDAPTDISSNTAISYSSPALHQTTLYRRRVNSQICESLSNVIQITVYPLINNNVIEGAPVQYSCFNAPANVDGRTPGGGANTYSYEWQSSEDNSSWITAVGQNGNVDFVSEALTDSIYFRRITFSGSSNECIDTSSSIKMLLNPLPEGDIESSIDTACAGDNILVSYTVSGNGPWDLSFGNESAFYTAENVESATGTLEVPVDYEDAGIVRLFELRDDSACYADLSGATGEITLEVYEVPEPDAGIHDSVCGLIYRLQATPSVGEGVWSGNTGNFENIFNESTNVTVSAYGEHIFTWTETNWNCITSDDVNLEFFEQPQEVDAGEDQTLVYDFITNMEALEPAIGSGIWSTINPDITFENNQLYNTEVEFPVLGTYNLVWTVTNGVCIPIFDSVQITVNDLKVYKGFSPNGDGINDEFILDLSGRHNTELIILNRWGRLEYKGEGIEEIRWDGKNTKGEDLPPDTYFYIINEDGETKTKGYIELRR